MWMNCAMTCGKTTRRFTLWTLTFTAWMCSTNAEMMVRCLNAEVIPEMQKKLRQGFGRAIRTEQDSYVVAILDERAGFGGKYHDAALAALPTCPTTEKIEDVQQFIREQKRPDYFL